MASEEDPDDMPRAPRMMRFRRSGSGLSADAARRQGEVTHLAFLALGGRDAALEFLNLPDSTLGGRPLDIAIASKEGAAKVTQAIRRLAGAGAKDQ
jgi:uncharacterized protein (DUF2384 family)